MESTPPTLTTAQDYFRDSLQRMRTESGRELLRDLYRDGAGKSSLSELTRDEVLSTYGEIARCSMQSMSMSPSWSQRRFVNCVENLRAAQLQVGGDIDAVAQEQQRRSVRAYTELDQTLAAVVLESNGASPILRHILMSDAECREALLDVMELLRPYDGAVEAVSTFMRKWSEVVRANFGALRYVARVEGLHVNDSSMQLMARGVAAQIRLQVEHLQSFRDHPQAYAWNPEDVVAKDELRPYIASANPMTQVTVLPMWVRQRYDAQAVCDIAMTHPFKGDAMDAVRSLLKYRSHEAMHCLLDIVRQGPFDLAYAAEQVLRRHSDAQLVHSHAVNGQSDADAYVRATSNRVAYEQAFLLEGKNEAERAVRQELHQLMGRVGRRKRSLTHGMETFVTTFFRFAEQYQWVVQAARRVCADNTADRKVRIAIVGASYGPEAFSLMMQMEQDYRNTPERWGHVSPWDQVEIIATDIDTRALRYTERGVMMDHPSLALSDVGKLETFAQTLGIDVQDFFATEKNAYGNLRYQLKPQWKHCIRTAKLNVLDPEPFLASEGPVDIALFNMVDGHLTSDAARKEAVQNLQALTTQYVAAAPRELVTRDALYREYEVQRDNGVALLLRPLTKAATPMRTAKAARAVFPELQRLEPSADTIAQSAGK